MNGPLLTHSRRDVLRALMQVAAEELEVDPHAIRLVTADTTRTANEGFTSGSNWIRRPPFATRRRRCVKS